MPKSGNVIIKEKLKSAFNDALSEVDPQYRNSETPRLVPELGSRKLKLFMIDTPTDKALSDIKIDTKTKMINSKIEDVLSDYKDLEKLINIKLRTIGKLSDKMLKNKYKIIV